MGDQCVHACEPACVRACVPACVRACVCVGHPLENATCLTFTQRNRQQPRQIRFLRIRLKMRGASHAKSPRHERDNTSTFAPYHDGSGNAITQWLSQCHLTVALKVPAHGGSHSAISRWLSQCRLTVALTVPSHGGSHSAVTRWLSQCHLTVALTMPSHGGSHSAVTRWSHGALKHAVEHHPQDPLLLLHGESLLASHLDSFHSISFHPLPSPLSQSPVCHLQLWDPKIPPSPSLPSSPLFSAEPSPPLPSPPTTALTRCSPPSSRIRRWQRRCCWWACSCWS